MKRVRKSYISRDQMYWLSSKGNARNLQNFHVLEWNLCVSGQIGLAKGVMIQLTHANACKFRYSSFYRRVLKNYTNLFF